MTKNQKAMKNLARGSVRGQFGQGDLTPKNRRRLEKGALKHWQALDAARAARYRRRRIDRDRKEADLEGRSFQPPAEVTRTVVERVEAPTATVPKPPETDKIAKPKLTKAKVPKPKAEGRETVAAAESAPKEKKVAEKTKKSEPKVETKVVKKATKPKVEKSE